MVLSKTLMIAWWLLIIVLAGIAEAVTIALVSIWFIIGATVALLATYLGATPMIQFVLFFAMSGLSGLTMYPLLNVRRKGKNPKLPSNIDRYIGKIANVMEPIDNITGSGRAMYGGVSWAARSSDDDVKIQDGQVRILKVEGSKLIVEPFKK